MVAMEISTNVHCTYCPGAALGADDLLENGKFVAVMEDHNNAQGSDPFANTASIARTSFYNLTGNPTAVFDGTVKVVGGNHTQSMYTTYLPKYNQCIAVPSHLNMSMDVTNTGLDYTIVVNLEKIGDLTSTNVHLLFAVTLSHVVYSWEGQSTINYANMKMTPDANGTVVDLSGGSAQVTLNVTLDAAWPLADLEFIAFAQDYSTKSILQTIKRGVVDLTPEFSASSTEIERNVPVTFTNETTGGYMNVPETYEWQFPGGMPETSTDANPVVTYAELGSYDVMLIVNRGGQIDTLTKPAYITVTPGVGIQEKSTDLNALVFPSPNNGAFTLELNAAKNEVVNITIINAANSVVFEEKGVAVNGKLDRNYNLQNLSSGTYFVVIQNGDNKIIRKFSVK